MPLLPRLALPFLALFAAHATSATSPMPNDGATERAYLVDVLRRIAEPVLTSGAANTLKKDLPNTNRQRAPYAPLEAVGRTLAGIAPWLELGPGTDEEGQLRARYIELAEQTIENAVDPKSPGRLIFDKGGQPLVDAAFLSQALLRAPNQLWGNLSETTRGHLVEALKSSRAIKPGESNWLLFSAMVEAALWEFTGSCEMKPIEYAVGRHLEWYKGDGTYGDGPTFHWDYYNSFVIQPMLWEVIELCARKNHPLGAHLELVRTRAIRFAAVQERLISPEGTFPVIGRSSTYRFGALQSLAQVTLRRELPADLPAGGVRNALTAVIRRMIEAPGTFDNRGWLTLGAAGYQPKLAESYINTGSVYLCTFGLLQLGLPANDAFWTAPAAPWTQQRIWSGEDIPADHAIKD